MTTDSIQLPAEVRSKTGSADARRLRRSGRIPASVYGHGEDPSSVSVPSEAVDRFLQSGGQIADLEVGSDSQKVLLKEVQWDAFGSEILHVDLLRVSKGELIETDLAIELHGIAPGVTAGGVLDHHLHAIQISCPALQIPDTLQINVNDLEIGGAIHVSDLDLPDNVEILTPAETMVVGVSEAREVEEEDTDAGPVEPEVIGRSSEDADE